MVDEALEKASQLKENARMEGQQKGQIEADNLLLETTEEIERTIQQARNWAEKYRQKHHHTIEDAVDWAVSILLGLDREGREGLELDS